MEIKKLSRFKKWLAIASSTAVVSSLLLMFAGLNVSKANDVKQVNNVQNQALQSRSAQPKAAGAIDGDYLLDSNNAIPVRDRNGNVTNHRYIAMRSDGIGIGPKGYLLHNRDTGKWDYVGYETV